METNGTATNKKSPVAIPDQRTLALMNIYIANTTKTVNEVAALCERKVHDVDRRLRRISINMSLLEAKVDSAVASQNAAALPLAGEQAAASASSSQVQQVVEQPLSTAPSVSDAMEEIDVGTPIVPKDDHNKRRELRADYENIQEGAT